MAGLSSFGSPLPAVQSRKLIREPASATELGQDDTETNEARGLVGICVSLRARPAATRQAPVSIAGLKSA